MTPDQKNLITKTNQKKDEMENQVKEYIKEWNKKIIQDCYYQGIFSSTKDQLCESTLKHYTGKNQVYRVVDPVASKPGNIQYKKDVGMMINFSDCSFEFQLNDNSRFKEKHILFKIGYVMPIDIDMKPIMQKNIFQTL